MKILLVGNYAPDRQRSMQLYAKLLLDGLRARGHAVELLQPTVMLGGWSKEVTAAAKWLGYMDKFLLFRRRLARAAEQADVVHLCDHSNAMYLPALRHVPHVVTCHDLLAIRSSMGHFPQNPVGPTGRIFQRMIARGLKQAPLILCVSAKTRDDLRDCLGIPAERLRVVPNALNYPYAPMDAARRAPLLTALGLEHSRRYFFHIGANHWYKNRGAAIAIFAALRKLPEFQDTRLVMAGGPLTPALHAAVRQHALEAAVVDAGQPTPEQLAALYSGTLATLFPSLEEGFGWPIVEAQACGSPVAIADRPPMNEVGGDAAIRVDPGDAENAALRIREGLRCNSEVGTAGLRNAARYSVTSMLEACESAYGEAIAPLYLSS